MYKKLISTAVVFIILFFGYYIGQYTATNSKQNESKAEKKIKYWVAPMDANYRRDKPGKSPMGMDLVPVYEEATKKNDSQPKIKYWVAPMDANYRRDKPGKSPMGMDLVPVYEDTENDDQSIVKISGQVENNLGVKSELVTRSNLSQTISTVGYATADENKIEHVTTYIDGWIRNLAVKTTGEVVKKGQLLFKLYSPALVQAQEEYVLAIKRNNTDLIAAGEQKLATLGVSKDQIKKLNQSKKVMNEIKIFSEKSGIVSKLKAREGMFVKPDMEIMTIEDLSHIWVIAEVFERQSNLVKIGLNSVASFPYMPNKEWIGKVEYVYPKLDQETHTLRVRLSFPNMDLLIKPNMYANIKIHSNPMKDVLTIPDTALIRTSTDDRVILSLGDGKYRAQSIKVGYQSDDKYVVLAGLEEGDSIVSSAQFLIDSESSLKASFARLEGSSNKSELVKEKVSLKEYMTMAVVKDIFKDKRRVLLAHEEIPEIGMPAMKMEVDVAPDINLDTLHKEDSIHAIVIQQESGELLMTKIHIMPAD
tara:strand:- start:13983 stop:15581 length:1599 start_codon:yes stop_codon:yes gene_type:complete